MSKTNGDMDLQESTRRFEMKGYIAEGIEWLGLCDTIELWRKGSFATREQRLQSMDVVSQRIYFKGNLMWRNRITYGLVT